MTAHRRRNRLRSIEQALIAKYRLDLTEHWVDVPEVGAAVRVMVGGDGPPVLLAHGVTATWSNFATLLPHVEGFRYMLPDLPGHGLSAPIDFTGRNVRSDLAATVWRVCDAHASDSSVALVGNSLGGLACLYAAAARPDRVTAVVALGEPAAAFADARAVAPLNMIGWPLVGRAALAAPPLPLPLYRQTIRRGFGGDALARVDPLLLDANRLAVAAGGHAGSASSLLHALLDWRGRPRPQWVLREEEVGALDLPVLFVWGATDPFQSLETARRDIARFPRATLHVVEGRHVPWLEDVAARGGLIRQFLLDNAG